MMRTLVITPCTAEKRREVPDPARAADLGDPGRRKQAEARLAAFAAPAAEMYTGTHHRLVMEGVRAVWERWGKQVLEVMILSGGYGLLRAEEVIVPYDVSLKEFDEASLPEWAARLRIPEEVASCVSDFDLVFYLLHGRYLSVLDLPLDVPDSVQQIVLTTEDDLASLPPGTRLHPVVAAGGTAARRWHVKAPRVRGFLFGRLCRQVLQHGPVVLEWLRDHPEDTERLFYKRARWRPQLAFW
jgi:hypothetical protein